MSITKKEIALTLAERFGLTQVDAKNIVQGTFDAILDVLKTEGRIELRDFGVFEVKERKARIARNPRTGAPVQVPAKRIVTFKPGREMAAKVATAAAPGVSDGDGRPAPAQRPRSS